MINEVAMKTEVFKIIEQYETIIIHRHTKPDGDALGSQLGLKEAILANYPNKKVIATGDKSTKFLFLGTMDEVEDEDYINALIIIVDTPLVNQISDDRYKLGKYIIKIDHHVNMEEYGDLQVVDTTYESTSGLIANLFLESGKTLSKTCAKLFFTGIVTYSGRFRFDSVTSRTFEIAAKLLKYDFNMNEVYNNLYLDDLKMVKLRAKFIVNFQLTKHNVAYVKTTAKELDDYDADLYMISRGMVNTMGGIDGIDVWVTFTEDENNGKVLAEIRSNKYDINVVAKNYGGEGVKGSSGAILSSFKEADRMLIDLDNLIKESE